MRAASAVAAIVAALALFGGALGADRPSLLPNGGAESVMVNDIEQFPSYSSVIHPDGRGYLPYWTLSTGARVTEEDQFSGKRSVHLTGGEEEVKAVLQADFWTVKDGRMPFGLPIVPGEDIEITFAYKTAGITGDRPFRAVIRLGAVRDRPSLVKELTLPAAADWTIVRESLRSADWKWGAEISFLLPAGSPEAAAWVDDVELFQDIEGVNLVRNPGFEEVSAITPFPEWGVPSEDQWVSWVGASYRPPEIETGESASGRRSLRASVVYTEGSGISQRIRINQRSLRPIVLSAKSKLDNSVGNSPPGYWGPDNLANLTVFVFFTDGTMQEVSPTFSLGVSDHDWADFRFGFLPLKPVEEIEVRITVLGSEPTTTLWVDDIRAFEWATPEAELIRRGVAIPPRVLSASWGDGTRLAARKGIRAENDATHLFLWIPQRGKTDMRVYLHPRVRSDFLNHERFLFSVLRISADGSGSLGTVVEKQGYTSEGLFAPAAEKGVRIEEAGTGWRISVPFAALGLEGPGQDEFGFTIAWKAGRRETLWSGRAPNSREMGRIELARPPSIRVKSVRFGRRYFEETDQSQDFISHPQIYAGLNQAEVVLVNEDVRPRSLSLRAGMSDGPAVRRQVDIEAGECCAVPLEYDAGLGRMSSFQLVIEEGGRSLLDRYYPLIVPPAIEAVLDQDHYFPEEQARLEIHARLRPLGAGGKVRVELRDRTQDKVLMVLDRAISESLTEIPLDISDLRVNPLPVQDYEMVASYRDRTGRELGRARIPFGRIRPIERRPLPPIQKVELDENGFLVLNGNVRFFPIVPSVNVMEWDDAIRLGANVYRGQYHQGAASLEDRDKAWALNAYSIIIGPGSPHPGDPDILDRFAAEAEGLLVHPGFLGCYGKQFYYWRLTDDLVRYRRRVEEIVAGLTSPRLVIWGHHDSSFLYDRKGPDWDIGPRPPVGYCYVKIMGRPGSAWRNAPFLTKTETVLNPGRFRLAEVNYYVSFHADEVVPEQYPGYLSLRGDDWRGFRAESYLAVIYGANGLYHWVCTQKHQLQRLRGWFQEMDFMWPILAARDSDIPVRVEPVSGRIETRLKTWEGKLYLLAALVGDAGTEAEIALNGLGGMKVRKLFDVPGEMRVERDVIKDVWHQYDVHVYEIEPSGPAKAGSADSR